MTLVFVEGVEYALTGYYTHANAIEQRERFLGLLKAFLTTSTSLKSDSPLFDKLSGNITSMLKLVDFYSDKVAVYTSKTAKEPSDNKRIDGAGEFKATITLMNAKNAFFHFYNIAKFKSNLQTSSEEMKGYNKDYTAVVGMAIGREMDKCAESYENIRKELSDTTTGVGAAIANIKDTTTVSFTQDEYLKKEEWTKESILEIHKTFMDGKMKLYKVAQAIDMYLVKFTEMMFVKLLNYFKILN
jgi:hypothetical protein